MRSAPRIQLRTIFVLVSCAAVGLAADPNPKSALGPIIQAVMIIGLLQQIRTLVAWRSTQLPLASEIKFAWSFAIFWRIAVATTFAGFILYSMLLSRGFLSTLDRHELLLIEPLRDGVIYVLMLVVLCSSLARWRSAARESNRTALYSTLLWLGSLSIIGLVLLDATITQFLVHRALTGIEASQQPRFHRQGVYIPIAADAYLPLWFGLAAAISLLVGLLIMIWVHKSKLNMSRYAGGMLAFTTLMTVPTAYCWWWYAREFPRLSPDMAGVGLALTRFDFVCGIVVALTLIAGIAYRIAIMPTTSVIVCPNMADDIDRTSLHESVPALFLFALIGISFIVSVIVSLSTAPWASAVRNVITFISTICYPPFLLPLTIMVAGLQLCWLRWRRRNEVVPAVLIGLSRGRFFTSSLMIAWILAAGVPAMRAFAFTAWAGPYDLLWIFRL